MRTEHATPEGTAAVAERHADMAYRGLGPTGLMVSQAGFGGYRVSADVQSHCGVSRGSRTHALDMAGVHAVAYQSRTAEVWM